jgi:methyl-accepting chemotaxis protein
MPRRADADGRRAVQGLLALRKTVAEHLEYNTKQGGIAVANNKAQHARSVAFLSVIVITVALTAIMALMLFRRIRGSLAQIQGSLEYVSRTLDLDHRAAVDRLDEIGLTAQSFNTLIERVAGTLRDVRRSTDSVGARGRADRRREHRPVLAHRTAGGLARGNRLEHGAIEHDRAPERRQRPQASSLAGNAAQVADQGNQAVKQMVETMGAISTSSGASPRSRT